jgi:hypothetical protein
MQSKLRLTLALALVCGLLLSSAALAQEKLLCVSNKELKGQETVASCLAKGERFAVVDRYGIVHVLTPEEVDLTRAFNPKVFEQRAYGMPYIRLAPPLPPFAVPQEAQ